MVLIMRFAVPFDGLVVLGEVKFFVEGGTVGWISGG
jgi:hypothetical protein